MAERYECFGLEDLVARPEDAFRLAGLAMTGGQRVRGYRGDYYRYFLGDAQVVVRTMGDPDTGEEQLLGMDVQHAEGRPWKCRIIKDVTPEDADPLCRRLLVAAEGTEDTAVVDVICADVLPDYTPGRRLGLRVTACPLRLHYDDEPCKPVVEAQQDTVLLQGTVKDVRVGETYMGLEPMTRFISVTVATSMGEVELCHVSEMVAEEQKDLVRVGATVSALCQLSGDAAVGEYAGGVVLGEEQDLVLLRDFFLHGGAQRLRSVMHSECRYVNDYAGVVREGADHVTALLRDMEQDMAGKWAVTWGRITTVEQTGENPPACVPGKRCLLLAPAEKPEQYAALCLVETDSLGRIRSLKLSRDPRYDFEPEM